MFLTIHTKFSSTYDKPVECISDHAGQAICGMTSTALEPVRTASGLQGTKWTFTEKGCSWRNGSCEQAIRFARHTLFHVLPKYGILAFVEFDAVSTRWPTS